MGRPSVGTERRRQIIDAVLRTLATYGISGATMDRIAAEAGMARGHIRHFVGNRDELLVATALEVFGDGDRTFLPPEITTLDGALDYLFSEEFTAPGSENAAVVSLLEASHTVPGIAEIMAHAYSTGQRSIAAMISTQHPHATEADCDRAAYGIMTVALGNIFIADLESSAARNTTARSIVDQILQTFSEQETPQRPPVEAG